MTNGFQGWKIGGNLTPELADLLEPHIDVVTETIQELLRLNTANLTGQSQHALLLALVEYTGGAAAFVNQISLQLATEQNADEQLRILNSLASLLRLKLLTVAALANVAIVALDKTLKE